MKGIKNKPDFVEVYGRVNNVICEFSLNLAAIPHYPNEVMRVCGLLTFKKVKKVRDNYLTSAGYGALCGGESAR